MKPDSEAKPKAKRERKGAEPSPEDATIETLERTLDQRNAYIEELEAALRSREPSEANEEPDNTEDEALSAIERAAKAVTALSRFPIQNVQEITKRITAFQAAVTKLHKAERERSRLDKASKRNAR